MAVLNMKSLLSLALAVSPVISSAIPTLVARQDFGSCRNQSCAIATIAGSTGSEVYDFPFYPTGDTQDGDCCIVRNFPLIKNTVYEFRPGLQAYCAAHGGDAAVEENPPGITTVSVVDPPAATGASKAKRATCKPNILVFVKGTLEPGDLGITIGPMVQNGLDSNLWDVRGVNYDNSFDNDYCLGLPGNVQARQVLHQAITDCPNANIAVGGYSQGAMVIRNALARAPLADVQRVTNLVNFGDPFVGSEIGQYTGPIHVFCMTDDGVCNGQLDLSLAHLSYFLDVSQAVAILAAGQKTA